METEFFRFAEVSQGAENYERYLELRYEVFCEELKRVEPPRGCISSHGRPMEWDQYDAHSRHFLAVHKATGEPAACARVILPGPSGLNVTSRYVIDVGSIDGTAAPSIGEISRMATSKRFRRRREDAGTSAAGNPQEEVTFRLDGNRRHQPELVLGMYREIFLLCSRIGITHCYAAMDDRFSRLLRAVGFPFEAAGPINVHVSPARRVYIISSHEIEKSLSRRDERILRFVRGEHAHT